MNIESQYEYQYIIYILHPSKENSRNLIGVN